MLFNKNGFREFFAMQPNGQARQVAYEVSTNGKSIVREVDNLSTSEYPLPAQFSSIVVGWCDEHRENLKHHNEYRSAA